MTHKHKWAVVDRNSAWCVECYAESYYGEIIKEGEDENE